MNDENLTYFDSFGVEHIPRDIKKLIGNKNIKTNIYRIPAYFYTEFIDFMLKVKLF